MSWSNICTRMACVLGSCTSSHLSSFHVGVSVFFWCSCRRFWMVRSAHVTSIADDKMGQQHA